MGLEKYLHLPFDQESKMKIIDLIIRHVDEEASCRVGWAAEQILKQPQPNHVLNKITASLVQTGRYLKEKSKYNPKDLGHHQESQL